jgi:hypothetical protein
VPGELGLSKDMIKKRGVYTKDDRRRMIGEG